MFAFPSKVKIPEWYCNWVKIIGKYRRTGAGYIVDAGSNVICDIIRILKRFQAVVDMIGSNEITLIEVKNVITDDY